MLRLGTHESLGNAFLIVLKLKNSINNRGLSIFPNNQSSFIFSIFIKNVSLVRIANI